MAAIGESQAARQWHSGVTGMQSPNAEAIRRGQSFNLIYIPTAENLTFSRRR